METETKVYSWQKHRACGGVGLIWADPSYQLNIKTNPATVIELFVDRTGKSLRVLKCQDCGNKTGLSLNAKYRMFGTELPSAKKVR